MIQTLQEGSRLDVILSRPERLNAMTQVGAEIPKGVRVVVIRAEGRAFSAGLDRRVFAGQAKPDLFSLMAGTDGDVQMAIKGFQDAFTCWRKTDAITIAAVQGAAIGAGFQLALSCDFRIVADDSYFALRETSLGLVPDLAGTKPLVDLVGYSRALEIALTGEPVPAKAALQIGLVNAVVPVDELASAVDSFVTRLLALPEAAVRATKRLLTGATSRDSESQEEAERQAQNKLLRLLIG
jgi:enoyl-CoA hydratase/carnithine racemase